MRSVCEGTCSPAALKRSSLYASGTLTSSLARAHAPARPLPMLIVIGGAPSATRVNMKPFCWDTMKRVERSTFVGWG